MSGKLDRQAPHQALPGLDEAAAPHYHGHRERLRARFRDAGAEALADYELLELLLFRAIPRRDVKPLAKHLLARHGSFAEVISAPPERLSEAGLSVGAITELKLVQSAAQRLTRGEVRKRPVLSSWSAVLDYCRAAMAFADKEQFRILFLDKRNQLIADEVQQVGTVDHTPATRARSSSGRSNYRPLPSSWCTTIHPAIRRRARPTSR